MLRYLLLSLFPLIFVLALVAAIQTYKLSRSFPSSAWILKRWLMIGFMLWQAYGFVSVWLGYRGYLFGVLGLFVGLNVFDYLLIRDGRTLRAKVLKFDARDPLSGDMPPEFWSQRLSAGYS